MANKSNSKSQQHLHPDQFDPAILSCGPRPVSTPPTDLSKLEKRRGCNDSPSSDIIRYSRDRLLGLRNAELSRRKPEYTDDRRLWCRVINSNGSEESGAIASRHENRSDYHRGGKSSATTLSASSSTSSLANSSTSSYLLPSFACKRRPTGTSATPNATETKNRSTSGLRKESTPTDKPVKRGGSNGSSSTSANNGSNAAGGESMGRGERRIGSGRIPMRDVTWNEYRSTTDERESNESPTATTAASTSTPSVVTNIATSTTTTAANDSEYNFRPSGGLLGLRDRERGGESQTTSTTINTHQQHPILPRSLIDKDRNDFRSDRTSLLMSDDRYERRTFNRDRDRDRDYNLGSMDNKERSIRGDLRSSSSRDYRDHSSRFGSNNSHYNNNNSHHQSNQHHHNDHRRRMYDSRSHVMEEPEWFSGGPTSQNDVIELRGFDDPPPSGKKSPTYSNTRDFDDDNSDNADVNEGNRNERNAGKRSDEKGRSVFDNPKIHNVRSKDGNNNKDSEGANNQSKSKSSKRDGDNKTSDSGKNADTTESSVDANKNEDNFNFEDFLKLDSITDLLSVSSY